jgi:hypothetical protein
MFNPRRRGAMKRTLLVSTLAFVLLMSTAALEAQKTGATEQTIATLEGHWLKAQKDSNPDLLAPLLAEGFVNTSTESKVTNKPDTLAIVKSSKWNSADYQDVKVTIFGDTAIATGVFTGIGSDTSGKSVTVNERWTDTWVKMPNGKWQCVASHASPMKQ